MRFSLFRRVAAVTVWTVMACLMSRAEDGPPVTPPFKFATPTPAILTAAQTAGIHVAGLEMPVDRAGVLPGDSVTVLVSHTEGAKLSQWLIELVCVELNEKEKARPAVKPLVFFANTGTKIDLGGSRAAMAVRVIGPYKAGVPAKDAGREAKDLTQRVTVNADFLGLGFDRACESVLAVNNIRKANPDLPRFQWKVRQIPFPPEETDANRELADRLGLTPERERGASGAVPALYEFFHIMSRTKGLEDVVKSVMDVPWWALIKSGGKVKIQLWPQLNKAAELEDKEMAPRGQPYSLPFLLQINGKFALSGNLAVTRPRPPLLTCAGIYGVAAQSPDGKGPHLMMQLLSARLATAPKNAATLASP